jgi:anti-sigma factor RsiW
MNPTMDPTGDALDRDRSPSERLARLRAAADDELSPDEAAELERALVERPGDRAIIAFERNLRGAIARLHASAAPPILRDRVRAQLAREDRGRGGGIVGRIGLARRLAVAASIAIVAALSIVLLSRSGDRDAGRIAPPLRAGLVAFVGGQQRECELHADLIPER